MRNVQKHVPKQFSHGFEFLSFNKNLIYSFWENSIQKCSGLGGRAPGGGFWGETHPELESLEGRSCLTQTKKSTFSDKNVFLLELSETNAKKCSSKSEQTIFFCSDFDEIRVVLWGPEMGAHDVKSSKSLGRLQYA